MNAAVERGNRDGERALATNIYSAPPSWEGGQTVFGRLCLIFGLGRAGGKGDAKQGEE